MTKITSFFEQIITCLNQIILLMQTKTETLDHYDRKEPSLQPVTGTDPEDRFWLNFDDETRTVSWVGGYCFFRNRRLRRYQFVKLLWESLGEFVSYEEINQLIGDHANPQWDTIRVFGNRVERLELRPANCPFLILQEIQGFRMIRRS